MTDSGFKKFSFDYQIRYSPRATRVRLVVSDKKIEVVAPVDFPEQKLHEFVAKKRAWVERTLLKVKQKSVRNKALAPDTYEHGVLIPFKGEKYPLSLVFITGDSSRLVFSAQSGFTLYLNKKNSQHQIIRSVLIDWMLEQAAQDIEKYVSQHAVKLKLWPRSIRLKQQKSRWGSCGIHDDININWLLILTPPKVMEYVVVHELCHLKHRNHSRNFWNLVGKQIPDYQRHRNWLKEHGSAVMAGL